MERLKTMCGRQNIALLPQDVWFIHYLHGRRAFADMIVYDLEMRRFSWVVWVVPTESLASLYEVGRSDRVREDTVVEVEVRQGGT